MVQIFLLKNPLLRKGLKWYQKIGYFNSSFFWFFSFSRVIFLIAPLLYLIFGMRIYMANIKEVFAYAFPHFLGSVIVSNYLYGKVRWNFFSEIYELIQSVYTLPAILKVFLNPRSPKFGVTPKGENLARDFVSPFYKPFFVLFHLNLLSYLFAVYRWINFVDERGTVIITVYWNLLNTIFLMAALVIIREKRQLRQFYRIPVKDEAVIMDSQRRTYFARVEDISLGGVRLKLLEKSDFKEGEKIDIIFYTVTNEREILTAEIVKVREETFQHLHCKFVINNHEELSRLVKIIYGSSIRWEHFKEVEHKTPIGALIYILRKTLKYFPESYKMELEEFANELRERIFGRRVECREGQ
jgi:cellulose synthase (UDP-forming)